MDQVKTAHWLLAAPIDLLLIRNKPRPIPIMQATGLIVVTNVEPFIRLIIHLRWRQKPESSNIKFDMTAIL